MRRRRPPQTVAADSSDEDEPLSKISNCTTKRAKPSNDNDSSSESDIDNYLQRADKIDLNSSFFTLQKPDSFEKVESAILADINDINDSNESGDDKSEICATPSTSKLNFAQLHEYTKKLEEAKRHVEEYNAKKRARENDTNIENLLAAGESKQNQEVEFAEDVEDANYRSSEFESCSDSEKEGWEEVQDKKKEEGLVPKRDLQITVEMPGAVKKKKKGIDLLAAIKRRINRVRKENQVLVHKVHLLCWIAHGNYISSEINSENVLGVALSLLPSKQSYPDGRTDLTYLSGILKWYQKAVVNVEKKVDVPYGSLSEILQEQIAKKEACGKKMLVYIFVAILRALGIHCRLVLSFVVEPLRPPSSELHSLSTKTETQSETAPHKNKSEAVRAKTRSKSTGTDKNKNELASKSKTARSKSTGEAKESVKHTGKITRKCTKTTENEEKETSKPANRKRVSNAKAEVTPTKNTTTKRNDGEKTVKTNDEKKQVKSTKKNDEEKIKPTRKNDEEKKAKPTKQNDEEKKSKPSKLNNPEKKSKPTKQNQEEKKSKPTKQNDEEKKSKPTKQNQEEKKSKPTKQNDEEKKSRSTKQNDEEEKSKPTKQNIKEKKVKPTKKNDEEQNGKPKDTNKTGETKDEAATEQNQARQKNTRTLRSSKTPARVPQLDGADDSPSPSKPNLKNLNREPPICPSKNHPKRLRVKYRDTDSEDEFATRSPFTPKNTDSPQCTKKANLKKLKSVDVRSDVISIVKERIKNEKALAISRTASKRKSSREGDDDDSDYAPEEIKKKHYGSGDEFVPKVKVKRRVQVKDNVASDDNVKKKQGVDVWAEVFLEAEEKWISVDVVKGEIHCVNALYNRATHPISYVVAWNNDNSLKDITRRYCPNFNTVTRKLRIDAKWWEATVKAFLGPRTARDKEEDDEFERQHLEKPLPTSIAEYKNHPLYVLKRHLLKFEALYPADAPTLGFVRNEPVYSRHCVYTLHSREIWFKHAKVVKPGEQPYKIVKARPKWDKLSNTVITGQMLEIFGVWQTQDYEPPTAENGIVPRNAFGNIELFKSCMLPKKTVHLKLPGLNRVAKRMNIDCAPAVVGFDFHGGWNHPVYDGFVVCEEFEDVLIAAWDLEQEELDRKEQEKIDKRVYANWKRLIRGLLIRERLKVKYEFGAGPSGANEKKKGKVAKK